MDWDEYHGFLRPETPEEKAARNSRSAPMAKFRKKPVVIEAMRWDVIRMVDDLDYIVEVFGWLGHDAPVEAQDERLMIRTLEGNMYADPGDWIIRGIKGELYPCKPDIFEATYEEVTDGE